MEASHRIITYSEMKPGAVDITKELDKNKEEEDIPLVAVVSHSEDDAVATVSEDEDGEEETKRRRVRFDETVQVSTFVKAPAVYPKTPPRRKKCSTVKEESEDTPEKTTPRTRRATPKKKPAEITLTPRRMSLRSASKLPRNETSMTSEEVVEPTIITASRSPRRRSTSKSASKKTEEPAVVEDAESVKPKPSPSTPSRTTRRSLSQSPASAIVENKKVTKMDKLKALNLLGKVPKSVQRELQMPLQRIEKHGKDAPEHLQLLVVDFPTAAQLIHLLCEYPTLVDTVLMQLRIHSLGN